MSQSSLQEPFLREVAKAYRIAVDVILDRLAKAPGDAANIVEDELRALYHDVFVIFDGGTALADKGLLHIIDQDGVPFDRYLHEICFGYWPPRTGGA